MVARFLNAFHDLQASMTTSLLPVAAFFAAGAAAGAASFALRLGGIHTYVWLGTDGRAPVNFGERGGNR